MMRKKEIIVMIKVYGNMNCPYCVVMKENLDLNNVEYEFVDVLASLSNLGSFLALRDREPVFDELKSMNDIGLPAFIDQDNRVRIDWENWLIENGYEIKVPKATIFENSSCSLDRKGC